MCPVERFVQERCETGLECRQPSEPLLEAFRAWCLEKNELALDDRRLVAMFEMHGYSKHRTGAAQVWRGLALR